MSNLQSQSFARRKRLKHWLISISIVVIVVIIIFCISWLAKASFMNISEVNVFGADDDISGQIHGVAMADLTGKYLWLLPKTNILIYPKQNIVEDIKSDFPRVLNVTIKHDGFHKINVTVNEKVPEAVVCAMLPNFENNTLLLHDSDPCYMTDTNGYLFKPNSTFSGETYNVYFVPEIQAVNQTNSSSTDYSGTYATSTDEFKELQSMYNSARDAGIVINGLLIKDSGEYEMYASSTIVYFNDAKNIRDERDNLVAFWKHMMSDSSKSDNVTAPLFDYIDLRYGSNVFYKQLK